jgi:hypothetical protein
MRLRDGALALTLFLGCAKNAALTPDGAASGSAGHGDAGQDAGSDSSAIAGSGGTRGGDAGVDSPAPVDARPHCPATPPKDGDLCTSNLFCEFPGSDPRGVCGPQADCVPDQDPNNLAGISHWIVSPPRPGCGIHPSPCPATFTTLAEGAACPAASGSLSCDYAEGTCGCLGCYGPGDAGAGSMWSCRPWASADPGCPTTAPLAGSDCVTPNVVCFYAPCGKIAVGDNLSCNDGTWQERGIGGACIIPVCSRPN